MRFRNFWAYVISPHVPMLSFLALIPMFTVMRKMSAMDGGLPSYNICPLQPLMLIPAVCEGLYVKAEILIMAWRRGETMEVVTIKGLYKAKQIERNETRIVLRWTTAKPKREMQRINSVRLALRSNCWDKTLRCR